MQATHARTYTYNTVPIKGLNLHAERCQGTLASASSERQDDHLVCVAHADRAGMTVNRRRRRGGADEMFLDETNTLIRRGDLMQLKRLGSLLGENR